MTAGAAGEVVAFLDNDHVLNVARALLRGQDPVTTRTVEEFLGPERAALDDLLTENALADVELVGPPTEYGAVADPPRRTTVLVTRRAPVTASLMRRLPRLRHVQQLGDAADTVDHTWATAHGIEVECVPRPSLEATAEHAVLLMLALVHDLRSRERTARSAADPTGAPTGSGPQYNWAGLTDLGMLHGRTVGLIGLGEVGIRVARRLRVFGVRVLYCSRSRSSAAQEQQLGVSWRERDRLLTESDLVSLHVPGTPENRGLVDADFLRLMPRRSFLVNVARGSLVDEVALVRALREERIRGAALDVHAREPRRAGDPLLTADRVILTPHIAGGTRTAVLDEIRAVAHGVRRAVDVKVATDA